jgi:hypothetical protein
LSIGSYDDKVQRPSGFRRILTAVEHVLQVAVLTYPVQYLYMATNLSRFGHAAQCSARHCLRYMPKLGCILYGETALVHNTNHALSRGQYWGTMGGPLVAFWVLYGAMVLLQLTVVKIGLRRIFIDMLMWVAILACSISHLVLLGDRACVMNQFGQALSMVFLAFIAWLIRSGYGLYRMSTA